jgi:CBS domain containing-hemolysin-like protein
MLNFAIAVALALVVLLAVVAQRTYYALPSKELKRRAETGDAEAANLWRAVGYGPSLRAFLWVVIVMSAAACFVLLARIAPPLLGFVTVGLLLYVLFAWMPTARPHSLEARVTDMVTPGVAWLVSTLDPVLARIYSLVHRRPDGHLHTGVYIRQDLLALIEQQKSQADNQLSIEELDLAATALRFGDKKVRNLLVKRKKVQTVDAKADISPVFLNDLHQSGHSRFPVYDGEADNIVGTLYLHDLTAVGNGKGARGKVRTHMNAGVVYLHEADSLADALHAFYLTKKQLFVVINKFEEYVGIITIEDVLHALLGVPGEYEFDQHENRGAVAAKHVKKPKIVDDHIDETAAEAPKAETSPPTPDEVVE